MLTYNNKDTYDLASQDPRFKEVQDFRFEGSPHDALIDTSAGDFGIRSTPAANFKTAGDLSIPVTREGVEKVRNDFRPFGL